MSPKIFVSSTILDFEDLRSVLKYYLEEYGYDVQMSEYPDFDINPDKSTFESCLHNLSDCQYFIQLIGYRRGSWYKENELSITHLEYKAAKTLIEQGNPLRIISFVRKPIWLLKNDRDALTAHFKKESEVLSKIIKQTGSTIIDDPDYIFNFINEVAEGIVFPGSDIPANNWIYDFVQFEDIITVLKHTFKITELIQEKKIKRLFKLELERNKNRFLIPAKGVKVEDYDDIRKMPQENLLEYFAKNYFPRLFNSKGEPTIGDIELTIPGKEVGWLLFYSTIVPIQKGLKDVETTILEKILSGGTFLNFNIEKNDFDTSYFTYALEKLLDWIKVFKNIYKTDFHDVFQKEISKIAVDGSAHLPYVSLSMQSAGFILGLANGVRICELIDTVLKVLEENDYQALLDFDFSDKFYHKYLQ